MTTENPESAYFVKADTETGKILGYGILRPENAASVIMSAGQVVMETREAVVPGLHVYIDMETHELLGEDMRPVAPPAERPPPAMNAGGGQVVFLPPDKPPIDPPPTEETP